MAAGRLVAPLAGRGQDISYIGHHFVCPLDARRRAPLRDFARWLAEELGIALSPDLG